MKLKLDPKVLKFVGACALSSGVGFGGGFLLAKYIPLKKVEKQIDEAQKRLDILVKAATDFETNDKDPITVDKKLEDEEKERKEAEEKRKEDIEEYWMISESYKVPGEDELSDKPNSKIYTISAEESDRMEGYKQIRINFYMDDKVFTYAENDRVIEDIGYKLGPDAIERFGLDQVIDNYYIWVRNDELKEDYEIERLDISYHKDVLGVDS